MPARRMLNFDFISIKSRIGVEYRRYALKNSDAHNFDDFYKRIESYHQLGGIPFLIFYPDPDDDFLLPINNDDNLAKAIKSAEHIYLSNITERRNNNNNNYYAALIRRPYLKIFIEEKGNFLDYHNGKLPGKCKKGQNFKSLTNFISSPSDQSPRPSIGAPEDFRQVSSILSLDDRSVSACRRVRIVKHGSDRPLGFYIRDGTYKRMNQFGQVELVTGVFISRLVPGGLAESTGLLAENDEVLEVNGIQVMHGKTLDQVTDMMVANSSNLIMTIRPNRVQYYS